MHKDRKGDKKKPEPIDLKKSVSGVLVLVLVCAVLWGIASYGPGGADWLGSQTKKLFHLSDNTPIKVEEASVGQAPIPVPDVKAPAAEIELTGDAQIDNARLQIIKALGGPDKVEVHQLAISQDGQSMVAAIKLSDVPKIMEVYFELDSFERFVSTSESPIDTEIKIWKKK